MNANEREFFEREGLLEKQTRLLVPWLGLLASIRVHSMN
jgi:hypothetical protein